MTIPTKIYCSQCEEWKPAAEFYLERKDGDKRRTPCKNCYGAIYNRDYRKSLGERV